MTYPLPANETARLLVLGELQLLEPAPESAFDDLTALAAEICEAPIALISIIAEQRQWFKSRVGTELWHTARDVAFCNHTICQDNLFIVPDTLEDDRFAQNPLVTNEPLIRFYAGAPLVTRDGHAVGTLCVLDRVPRSLTEQQQRTLRVLSQHVAAQIEVRRLNVIRRQAEAALTQSHADLERRVAERTRQLQMAVKQALLDKLQISNMVERMSDGMVALDPQWRFDYVNRKAGELLALEPTAMIGQTLNEAFPGADRHPFFAQCQDAVHDERAMKCELYYARRRVWLEVRCYPSREGVSIFFQDVTGRKEAERKLDHERELSETIVASLPGSFYLFDEDGKYLRWNQQAEATTGFSAEDFTRIHPLETVAPADHACTTEGIRRVFETGSAVVEARLRHHGTGEERWHLLTGRYIGVEGRRCLLGIGIDIADRKAAEGALRASREQLRALAEHLHSVREEEAGRIARELHDEMGASLTGLKMDLGWLERQIARLLEPTAGEPLQARLAEINRKVDLTLDSMREVCHALRPAVLDQLGLAEAIDWQCAEFEARTGVLCRVDRDEPLALEDARSTAVFRILQELLTNVTRHARATEVAVSARCADGAFTMTVADNGCGLPADAFARRHSFGLVGVRERALAASGQVSFEPTPGGGTTAYLRLPLSAEKKESA